MSSPPCSVQTNHLMSGQTSSNTSSCNSERPAMASEPAETAVTPAGSTQSSVRARRRQLYNLEAARKPPMQPHTPARANTHLGGIPAEHRVKLKLLLPPLAGMHAQAAGQRVGDAAGLRLLCRVGAGAAAREGPAAAAWWLPHAQRWPAHACQRASLQLLAGIGTSRTTHG